ncbi:MAG: sterol desaturase family protein [Verrucomicrobiales bacterium]
MPFDFLFNLDPLRASAVFVAGNIVAFAISAASVALFRRRFSRRLLTPEPEPIRLSDAVLAGVAVLLNAGVGMAGWILWKAGAVALTSPSVARTLFDAALMLLAMDLEMFALHWVAHRPLPYRLFHARHHRHERTNAISLFVLHPAEVLGFGALIIGWLVLYPMSGPGLLIYLALNLAFGTLGHLGSEPLPAAARRHPLGRWLGTATFHGDHHLHPDRNFGFYTRLWDRLFQTDHGDPDPR